MERTPTKERPRRITCSRAVGAAAVAVMALVLAACQPVGIGNPGAQVGNDPDPANCPGLQPSNAPPCGPQPLLWASINGPYAPFENGDPYSTHCVRAGGSGTGCTQGNTLYRATGYTYVIDVAPADVAKTLTLQGYDVGSYPRTVATGNAAAGVARTVADLSTTNGLSTISSPSAGFTSADVGQRVYASKVASGTTIMSVQSATNATLSRSATGTAVGQATIGSDCTTNASPWNAPAFSGMSGGNCQTGDDSDVGGQNIDVQVFDNDGSGNPSYAVPLPGCHFSHSGPELAAAPGTYKNQWADLCSFTPTKQGIYAFRFRNSGIDGMTDVGVGNNQYALKLLGGTSTRLHASGDQSVFVNAANSIANLYLADVPAANAGKKLEIDLYDPGDGNGSSNYTLQVLGPPGGAPSPTPAGTGVAVPAAGIATACAYNATPSPDMGPATPDTAVNCAVVTHTAGNNIYNGRWLRIEVTLDPAYTCSSDCWWTLKYDFGVGGLPTDRLTYTVKIV